MVPVVLKRPRLAGGRESLAWRPPEDPQWPLLVAAKCGFSYDGIKYTLIAYVTDLDLLTQIGRVGLCRRLVPVRRSNASPTRPLETEGKPACAGEEVDKIGG